MIDSLSQLAEHCRRVAGRFPRLASRVRLEPSTVTEEDLSRLSVLWGKVPESYRQCIVSFNLAGVAVGYFELAPPMQQGETLVDALIRTKAERLAMEVPAALRLVGAYEGDPLLLDLRDEGAEGQVLRLDLGAGPRPQLTRVAKSFEQLLVAAGRLDQMVFEGADGWLPVEDFLESLESFNLDEEQMRNWRFFAETALVGG